MLDIVIIEDDLQLRDMLCYFLSEIEGYDIDSLDTGDGAVEFIIEKQPKLVLLDIQLPHTSGLSVLKTLKELKFEAPIVMMTANDTELTETNSLLLGANDYVTKPIRTKVLSERIKRQLDLYSAENQADEQQKAGLICNQFYLSAQHSSVFYNQIQIKLIPSEYELLEILSDAKQPIPVAVLFEKIHGFSYHEEDRSIYMRISSLRKKFAIQLPGIELIKNRRSKGFFLAYPMIKR